MRAFLEMQTTRKEIVYLRRSFPSSASLLLRVLCSNISIRKPSYKTLHADETIYQVVLLTPPTLPVCSCLLLKGIP